MISKLLIRPTPFMNESLASYINRLCNENVCKINWILDPIKVNMNKIYSILNGISNDEIIFKIIEATGLSEIEIKNMTCNRFIIKSSYDELLPSLWRNEVKCCPLCLQEKYYHQIHWQLKYVKICLKHNLVLNVECSCGKQIEMNELIEGGCRCGIEFSRLNPLHNRDEHIYINQYRVCEALEIKQNLREILPIESVFCGLDREKFLCIYSLILSLISNKDYTKLLELSEMYGLLLKRVNRINLLRIVEKILNNYPSDFYTLLDFSNNNHIPVYSYRGMPILANVCTPISCLEGSIGGKLQKLFHKEVHYYLITRYDHYNKKLLSISRLAKDNEYIGTDIAEHWYSFPYNSIDSLFKTRILEMSKYVDISEIINFINIFIKKGTVLFYEDRESFITLKEILDYFSTLKLELDIITRIILEKKIEIKICIYERGLDMIYVHKDSAIKAILQSILDDYREDKTF